MPKSEMTLDRGLGSLSVGAGGGRDQEFRRSSEKIECHRVWGFSPACSDCLREIASKIASLEGVWGDMGFEERRGGMK